ncbi:hypothetical protein LJB42_004110 [Komagataella kurtzmanii]|nr:hypothetical protein LJB42_004110 [Komagataella kurtzmanii]
MPSSKQYLPLNDRSWRIEARSTVEPSTEPDGQRSDEMLMETQAIELTSLDSAQLSRVSVHKTSQLEEDDFDSVLNDTDPEERLLTQDPVNGNMSTNGGSNFNENLLESRGKLKGQLLLYFTSFLVSLGVFLFGYDQGVMSGIITGKYFKQQFNNPSSAMIGTTVAILEIGAFFSSLTVGRVGDIIGRRRTIRYGAFIFVVGGLLQTAASNLKVLIAGRIISGIGVGLLSTIVPMYQAEISPSHNRGKLACAQFTGNIFGYASSIWVDYGCSFIENNLSWRIPLFIQCVIGSLLAGGSYIIVETPRWLLHKDRDMEGLVVIADLYTNGETDHHRARKEFDSIKSSILEARAIGEKRYIDLFTVYPKRLFMATSALAFAQFNGINIISYYAPLVFEQAGWIGREAVLMTGLNAIIYILSTLPPWLLIDRWGRKPILICGGITMGLSMLLVSIFMGLNLKNTPQLVVIFIIAANSSFAYSWGPIPWLFPSEILPLTFRSKGASLATATNWLANFIVGEFSPILLEKITWRVYLIHATFCFTSALVAYLVYPETRGVDLEDMDRLFDEKRK